MPKFIKCASKAEADEKRINAYQLMNPGWWAKQTDKYNANPWEVGVPNTPGVPRYKHPGIAKRSLMAHKAVVDPDTGECEIEIPDGEEVHYPDDNPGNVTNTRAIESPGQGV